MDAEEGHFLVSVFNISGFDTTECDQKKRMWKPTRKNNCFGKCELKRGHGIVSLLTPQQRNVLLF